ncbi:MAG: DNA alkylation repair protein [Nitratireductor sp.]
MDKSATAPQILDWLQHNGSTDNIAGMARYGIDTQRAFGVSNAQLRPLARAIGRNHERALQLWQSGWREARLLAAFTAEKKRLTIDEARSWAGDFNSWEIVDGTADLFAETSFWPQLVAEFAADEREFVRRAAFATLVWACVHRKKEQDEVFLAYFPMIRKHSADSRNFVKKAVNWALRQIGKRSANLHGPALALAQELARSDDKTERWIGRNAVKELESPAVKTRLKIA